MSAASRPIIDLRSDTVTLPSTGMREAMARAEVGDDQYGEDPTINLLQEQVAAMFGKEAALWLPTGTMANQAALRTLTRPGDDVIVSRESHAVWHEAGGAAALAGAQCTEIGTGGCFTVEEFVAAIKPPGHMLYPATTLVEIENTHNRAGGVIFPQDQAVRICAAARERNIRSYLDGARIWNVAAATGMSLADLAAPFDLVGAALSKGIGAPGGAILAGSRELIMGATRGRRILGGAMRQVGIFAAAALYGLEHNLRRLGEDHANARRIAERLAAVPGVRLDLASVQTNIVVFHLEPGAPDAPSLVAKMRERGVRLLAFGPRTIRLATHLDVSTEECEAAAAMIVAELERAG